MEACFNELTLSPLCATQEEVHERVTRYVDVVAKACEEGFKKICYSTALDEIAISGKETIASYCYKNIRDTKVQLLLSTQKRPYVGDKDEAETQNRYISANVYYCRNVDELKAEGFTAAYAKNTICVGLYVAPEWCGAEYEIKVVSDVSEEERITWICVTDTNHFDAECYKLWYSQNAPLSLGKCMIDPMWKKVSLRDDHGKDILEKHAGKLKQSPYVVEIVNSLPFNPHAKDYIHRVKENGIIEIVLTDTDEGLGLAVRTTGRSLRETKRIADILKEKYA
ncbi:MAG: hypothetical protein IKY84_01930 [Bacteroidaceae bacterium]|nr:hypothetical protein [Bacteroidaceae bacterium]